MEQLILHLIGDYVTQTDKMANEKTKSFKYAFIHAFTYTLPFLLIAQSLTALLVILVTHMIIDKYRLAVYLIYFKNYLSDNTLKWKDCSTTGFHKSKPSYIAFWLMIIVDNTMHLVINYLAIRFL